MAILSDDKRFQLILRAYVQLPLHLQRPRSTSTCRELGKEFSSIEVDGFFNRIEKEPHPDRFLAQLSTLLTPLSRLPLPTRFYDFYERLQTGLHRNRTISITYGSKSEYFQFRWLGSWAEDLLCDGDSSQEGIAESIRRRARCDETPAEQTERYIRLSWHYSNRYLYVLRRLPPDDNQPDLPFVPLAELVQSQGETDVAIAYMIDSQELWLIYCGFDLWRDEKLTYKRHARLPELGTIALAKLKEGPEDILNNTFEITDIVNTRGFQVFRCGFYNEKLIALDRLPEE
jgi:hypothetical protein